MPASVRARKHQRTASESSVSAGGSSWLGRAGLLLGLTALAYFPAYWSGFVWDDDAYVTQNVHLRSLDGLWRIWFDPAATPQYYPLVFSTFWVEYHLWGLAPAGFHIANVLLHGLCAVLFWRLLLRFQIPGAWLAAALFAVHPVHVESVAWITEQKNTLSLLFYLAAAEAYFRFDDDRQRGNVRWYVLSILLFAAALLSKTTAVTLPLALLIVLWWKRRIHWTRHVLSLSPMFALALAAGGMTWWVEHRHVGTERIDWQLSPFDRCVVASRAIWFYLGKLVFPNSLMFTYPRWDMAIGGSWLWVLSILLLFGALLALYNRKPEIGRAIAAVVMFFVVSLSPALGFINIYYYRYSFVADHFQYLPSLAIMAVAGAAAATAWNRWAGRGGLALGLAGATVVVTLLFFTWRQCLTYRDEETLWTATIQKNPAAWNALVNLGSIQKKQGRLAEAQRSFSSALLYRPSSFEAHYDLAGVLTKLGDLSGAEAQYREAIAIEPQFISSHFDYGRLLLASKRYSEAADKFETAVRLVPEYRSAHFNLGEARAAMNQHDAAIIHFRAAVELKPDAADLRRRLAQAYSAKSDWTSAIREFRKALELSPGDPKSAEGLREALSQSGAKSQP